MAETYGAVIQNNVSIDILSRVANALGYGLLLRKEARCVSSYSTTKIVMILLVTCAMTC